MVGPDTFVKIPKERVGILIGPEGKTKSYIEDRLGVKMDVDTEGTVNIVLTEKARDPSMLLKAKDVATAIGRGFPPETAFRLIRNEDDIFDMMDLRLIFGRSESDIKRVKGRIIGTEGKTRKLIEELTEVRRRRLWAHGGHNRQLRASRHRPPRRANDHRGLPAPNRLQVPAAQTH